MGIQGFCVCGVVVWLCRVEGLHVFRGVVMDRCLWSCRVERLLVFEEVVWGAGSGRL